MRTPTQVRADNFLTRAIEGVILAYGILPSAVSVVGDYVVVTSVDAIDPDGNLQSEMLWLVRDGDLATHTTLGLLTLAARRLDEVDLEG